MLHKLEATAVVDKGVAGNARLAVVGFAEPTVNDHQFSVGLYWVFAVLCVYGHVAVYDVAVAAFHFEGIEDAVAHSFGVAQLEVVAFSSAYVSLSVRK